MDYLRGLCPIQHNNQDHLSGEIKMKERNVMKFNNDPIDPERVRDA